MTQPDSDLLLELYKLTIEEYHFQVNLNWSRSQYFLGLNVAIIGVGTGLLRISGGEEASLLTGCLFLVGLATAVFSLFATRKGREYYRETRTRLKAVEAKLGLEEALTLRTTAGMKGRPSQRGAAWLTVTNFIYGLFVVLAGVDVIGLLYTMLK